MTGLSRPDAQNLLGRFLFSGWDAHEKQVAVLSGGERRRLALAVTVASGANFLVLDEPTNHLDLESREALEAALDAFPGTVLLVSHDRALLDAIAERTLAIEDGTLRAYDGGWAELLRAREEREARAKPEPPVEREKPSPKAPPTAKKTKLRRGSALDRIEAEIAAREVEVAELEAKLAEDWTDVDVLAAHRRSRDALTALLERWEQLFEQAQT
jgi:ATP-binding cassette subfamily F protein 3